MLLPVLIAYIYAEDDLLPSLAAASITGSIGLILMVTCRSKGELRLREGFALVTLTWLSFAFLGALPFYISGHIPSYTDAFFETMSGFTTTGARS